MATLNGYLDGLKHKSMNYVLISAKCLKRICKLEFCFFFSCVCVCALLRPDVHASAEKLSNFGIRDGFSFFLNLLRYLVLQHIKLNYINKPGL